MAQDKQSQPKIPKLSHLIERNRRKVFSFKIPSAEHLCGSGTDPDFPRNPLLLPGDGCIFWNVTFKFLFLECTQQYSPPLATKYVVTLLQPLRELPRVFREPKELVQVRWLRLILGEMQPREGEMVVWV